MDASPNIPGDTTSQDIEYLDGGATVEWLCDRQIVIVTATSPSRASVDAYMNRMTEHINQWPSTRPVRLVIDSSSKTMTRTPYMQARHREFRSLRQELKWYIGMVAPKSYLAQLMLIGARIMPGNQTFRLFFDREEAIKWIKSTL